MTEKECKKCGELYEYGKGCRPCARKMEVERRARIRDKEKAKSKKESVKVFFGRFGHPGVIKECA